MNTFLSVWKDHNRFRKLSLNFYSIEDMKEEFFFHLKRSNTLEYLELNIFISIKITEKSFRNLKQIRSLKHLKIALSLGSTGKIDVYDILAPIVKNMRSLSTLGISTNFYMDDIHKGSQRFFKEISKLKDLCKPKLDLTSFGMKNIDNVRTCIESLVCCLTKLKDLRILSINFTGWSKIDDECLQALALGFKGLSSLQQLRLSFDKLSLGNVKGLKVFYESIRGLESLRKFSVRFGAELVICENDIEIMRNEAELFSYHKEILLGNCLEN